MGTSLPEGLAPFLGDGKYSCVGSPCLAHFRHPLHSLAQTKLGVGSTHSLAPTRHRVYPEYSLATTRLGIPIEKDWTAGGVLMLGALG